MKVNQKIIQLLIIIEIAMMLFNVMMAQTTSKDFIIPQGWEETENWLPKFQKAFGTEVNYGDFFSIMSESDFLLTHSEYQGFIFVWQEAVDSQFKTKNKEANNKLFSFTSIQNTIEEINPYISISGMVGQQLANSRQITLHSASAGTQIHVLMISPKKSMFDVYHTDLLHEIVNSWNPVSEHISITNQTCGLNSCSLKGLK